MTSKRLSELARDMARERSLTLEEATQIVAENIESAARSAPKMGEGFKQAGAILGQRGGAVGSSPAS